MNDSADDTTPKPDDDAGRDKRTIQKSAPVTAEAVANRAKALGLRIDGASYREIARGVPCSLGQAHAYVQEALDEERQVVRERAEVVRELELGRLDRMYMKLMATQGASTNPRVVDTLLRIQERRARLLGLDAPTKWEGSGPDGGPIPVAVVDPQGALLKRIADMRRRLEEGNKPAPDEAPVTLPEGSPTT